MILDNKDKKRHSKKKVIFQTKKTKNEKSVISRNFIQFDPSAEKFSVSVQICTKIVKSLKHHKSLTVTLNISSA